MSNIKPNKMIVSMPIVNSTLDTPCPEFTMISKVFSDQLARLESVSITLMNRVAILKDFREPTEKAPTEGRKEPLGIIETLNSQLDEMNRLIRLLEESNRGLEKFVG